MAGQLKLRRGTTSQLANYIGSEGELTYDTALKSLVLHDGVTLGGVKIPYLSNDLVPSTMLPTATESVVGASKVATTAIAQAGTNDTDIITSKKLRDALNASGDAPISACRGRLVVNTKTSTILNSMNIQSFKKEGTGRFKITFINPMPHSNYAAFTNTITAIGAAPTTNTVVCSFDAQKTNTVNDCYFWVWSTSNGTLIDVDLLNIGVFC